MSFFFFVFGVMNIVGGAGVVFEMNVVFYVLSDHRGQRTVYWACQLTPSFSNCQG
jgi:hypothetical protein